MIDLAFRDPVRQAEPVTLQVILVAVLAVLALVAAVSFQTSETRRQAGNLGPRPAGSVGEALRQAAALPDGRVLVAVLAGTPERLAPALASSREPLRYVVLARGEEEQVTAHLFQKYAGEALPAGEWALLLDREGLPIAKVDLASQRDPLASWLPRWLETQPHFGRRPAGPGSP